MTEKPNDEQLGGENQPEDEDIFDGLDDIDLLGDDAGSSAEDEPDISDLLSEDVPADEDEEIEILDTNEIELVDTADTAADSPDEAVEELLADYSDADMEATASDEDIDIDALLADDLESADTEADSFAEVAAEASVESEPPMDEGLDDTFVDEPIGEEGSDEEVGAFLEEDEPATAEVDMAAVAAGADDEAEEPKKKGKGKGKGPRRGAGTGRGKKARAKKGTKKKTKKKAAKKPAPVAAGAGGASIPFVCSECYEDFLLPSNYSQETVTCPECLHVGKRSDEDFLHTVTVHKSGEKTSFMAAMVAGIALLLAAMFLMWLWSPYNSLELSADDLRIWTYGALGASGLLLVIFIWLMARFEGNRWEVYF